MAVVAALRAALTFIRNNNVVPALRITKRLQLFRRERICVRPDLLFADEKLLESRIATDRIPDRIDLQQLDRDETASAAGQ
jgi:hypothetical protein